MKKENFTDWLHMEFNAVFHGDITPDHAMLNAIPIIDAMFSQNNGKLIAGGSLPLLINGLNVEALANILYDKWALHYEGRVIMTRDLFTLAIQDIVRGK